MTPQDELPTGWQQMIDQIDAHDDAMRHTGAPSGPSVPPAPIVLAFWLVMLVAWAGVIYALGVVLGIVR